MAKGLKKRYIAFIIACITILLIAFLTIIIRVAVGSYNNLKNSENYKYEDRIDGNNDVSINRNLDSEEFKSNIYAFYKDGLYGFKNSYGEIVIEAKYDIAGNSSEGLAVVYENGKYGYIDLNGNLVIENKYNYALPFKNGLAVVDFEDGKEGIIDRDGNELFRNDKYKMFKIVDNYIVVGNNNEKIGMGYLDKNGKEIGEIKYDVLGKFVDGLAMVQYDDKYGYINEKGEEIIPLTYEYAEDFKNGYAIVNDGERSKLIDTKGNEVKVNLVSFENCYKGFVDGIIVGEDINTFEPVVLNTNFDEVYRISKDYAFTGVSNSGINIFYNDSNGLSFIDSKGNEKFKIDDADMGIYDSNEIKDYFIIEKYDGGDSVGVINLDGEEVIPFKYSNIEVIDKFFICTDKGIFGDKVDIYYENLKLTNNKIKVDYISKAGNGVLSIMKGDDIYYLNKYGQEF